MKRVKFLMALTIIIIMAAATAAVGYAGSDINLDIRNVSKGVFSVSTSDESGKAYKVMVEKDSDRLVYNLEPNGTEQVYPLQLGDGNYRISILVNKTGNQYAVAATKNIKVKLDNQNIVYLNSIKLVNFNDDMEVVKKAKEITKNLKTDNEKIDAIYQYVINQYTYDYNKKNLPVTYVPDLNRVFESKKGICYDYSSTVAAMLRSIGIPTKLVMGSSDYVNEYHAWNEVYDRDANVWRVIDSTKGSVYAKAGKAVSIYESADKYQVKYYY